MGTLREPYELSIWDDIVVPASGSVEEHFDEVKVATIGSNTLDTPLRAYNVSLKENINGEKILSFQMARKYTDEKGELVDNPFLGFLVNERKLKLRVGEAYPFSDDMHELTEEDTEERWIDFVLKTKEEDKNSHTNSYTAKELYVNELGKNGWATLLDTELENNYGTINELAETILDGSGWKVGSGSYSPTERIAQPLFVATVTSTFTARQIIPTTSAAITIPVGALIYPAYDCVEWNPSTSKWRIKTDKPLQFLFKGGTNNAFTVDDADDNRIIIDDKMEYNYQKVTTAAPVTSDVLMTGLNGEEALQGLIIIKSINSHYDGTLDRYVEEYKVASASSGRPIGSTVYGYTDTEYITSTIVNNYLTNNTNFVSNLAWLPQGTATEPYPTVLPYPTSANPSEWINSNPINYLNLPLNTINRSFYNEGPANIRMALTQDNIYVIRVKARMIKKESKDYGTNGANISIAAQPAIYADLGTYSPSQGFSAKTNSGSISLASGSIQGGTNTDTRGYGMVGSRVRYNGSTVAARTDEDRYAYIYVKANASTRASLDKMHLRLRNVSANTTHDYCIEDIQVFDYVEDVDNRPIFLGDIPKSEVKFLPKFYYVDSDDNVNFLSSNTSYYTPIYKDAYQSVRHLDVKESNYFNNISSLAELFEVWVRFRTRHQKNGKLLLDSEGKPQKEVLFSQYAPNGDLVNWSGFKYGINLNSIKRSMDSSQVASKVIVKNNNQKYAIDGMASISRAQDNPSGENEVYNFNYFVNQGLLGYNQMLADLYGMSSRDLGVLTRLKDFNNQYKEQAALLQGYETEIKIADANVEMYSEAIDSAIVTISQETFLYNSFASGDTARREQKKATITQLNAQLRSFRIAKAAFETRSTEYNKRKEETQVVIDNILEQKKLLKDKFHQKYARYIQEGTWTDDQYIDDELYYLDAVKLASISAFPKVSYQIGVIDIASLEGYAAYTFKVGNRTHIEDTDFFGWTLKNPGGLGTTKTPYKMEVVVSERTRNFDDQTKSTIVIQNYKNQFEELFQKITATTTALQYESGAYGRAADAISPTGELDINSLEKAMANNAFVLANSANQSVVWDNGRGIEITDTTNSSIMLRLVAGGLFMSTDGGRTWINGISGAGINTRYLLAGEIDAGKINIIANGVQVFRWDAEGLSAFYNEGDEYDATRFVRYNQYGIFGTTDGLGLEAALQVATSYQERLDAVREYSNWSLTWDGLYLQSQDGAVSLSPVNGLEVFNPEWFFPANTVLNYPFVTKPDGESLYDTVDKIPVVSLGRFFDEPHGTPYYGLRMRNKEGEITLRTESTGNLWLANLLTVGSPDKIQVLTDTISEALVTRDGAVLTFDLFDMPAEGTILNTATGVSYDYDITDYTQTDNVFSFRIPATSFDNETTTIPTGTYSLSYKRITVDSYRFLGINGAVDPSLTNIVDPVILYAGNMDENIAPFRVFSSGKFEATEADITGVINAIAGNFSGRVTVGGSSGIDGSEDALYAFWAGQTDIETAPPFYVTPSGELHATGAVIDGSGKFTGTIEADSGYFTGTINATDGLFLGAIYFNNISEDSYIGVNPDNPLFINIKDGTFGVGNEGDMYGDSLMLVRNPGWRDTAPELWNQYNILIGRFGAGDHVMEIFNSSTVDYQAERIFGIKTDGSVGINGTLTTDGDLNFAGSLLSTSGIMRIDGNSGSIVVKTPAVNGWGIYEQGDAYFSNVSVRGKISSAVFEYDNKSSVGGEMLISPSIYLLADLPPATTGTTMTYNIPPTYLNETWNNVNRVIVNINGTEIEGIFNYPILSLEQADLDSIALLESSSLPIGTQIISMSTEVNSIVLSAKDSKGSFISIKGPKNQMQGDTFYTTGIRYIRDWLNGSNVNSGNHWVQLQVFDANGIDIARGILPTSNAASFTTTQYSKPITGWTDGTSAATPYIESSDIGWKYLEVDLGRIRTDISAMNIKHYFSGNRQYNHRLEVSMDGEVWYKVFDSEAVGVYPEQPVGKTYNVIPSEQSAVLLGNLVSTQLPTSSIEMFGENLGYGLYADNAYLTGKLYLPQAGVTNETARYYDGVVSDGKQIRFWAGSTPQDMENAPFIVTQDGSLYALQGTFQGQIIADNSIFSGYLIATGVLIDPDQLSDHFFVSTPFEPADEPTPNNYIINIDKDGLHVWEGGLNIYSDYYGGWRGDNQYLDKLNPYYGYYEGVTDEKVIAPIFFVADKDPDDSFEPRISVVRQHVWFKDGDHADSTKIKPGCICFSNTPLSATSRDYRAEEKTVWNRTNILSIGEITLAGQSVYGIQGSNISFNDGAVEAFSIRPEQSRVSGVNVNTSLTTVLGLFNFGNVVQVSQETDGIIFTYIGTE